MNEKIAFFSKIRSAKAMEKLKFHVCLGNKKFKIFALKNADFFEKF